jgi:hypothetical protein
VTEEEVWQAVEPVIKKVLRSLVGAGLIVLCVIAGSFVTAGLGQIWPDRSMKGRDFWPVAVVIAGAGVWWFRSSVGGVWTTLGALGVIEIVVSTLICYQSGSRVGDPFFLSWFLGLNLFLGLPWLGGAILGFRWRRR